MRTPSKSLASQTCKRSSTHTLAWCVRVCWGFTSVASFYTVLNCYRVEERMLAGQGGVAFGWDGCRAGGKEGMVEMAG